MPVRRITPSGEVVDDEPLFAWKAMLQAHPSGGNYSVEATCTGCANSTAAVLQDVTFGDVWICSGQSNAWLPMKYTVTRNRTYDAIDNHVSE